MLLFVVRKTKMKHSNDVRKNNWNAEENKQQAIIFKV